MSEKQYAHSFTRKIVGFVYCAHCGLIRLNNDVTFKLVRTSCPR
jgi:hypothetical protein